MPYSAACTAGCFKSGLSPPNISVSDDVSRYRADKRVVLTGLPQVLQGASRTRRPLSAYSLAGAGVAAIFGQNHVNTRPAQFAQLPPMPVGAVITEPGADAFQGMMREGGGAIGPRHPVEGRGLARVGLVAVRVAGHDEMRERLRMVRGHGQRVGGNGGQGQGGTRGLRANAGRRRASWVRCTDATAAAVPPSSPKAKPARLFHSPRLMSPSITGLCRTGAG